MTGPFLLPDLCPTPQVMSASDLTYGKDRVLLLVVAHADDPAIFVGGVLALFVQAGWKVHVVRVTDDRWDSVGLPEAETIARNAAEFRAAAGVLGLAGVEDLGWQTDVLGDASRVALRERIIHAIRRLRPYALMCFDPNSMLYEDNLDHKVLAEAVDEAFWTAMFDKHHPEHFVDGLAPHGTVERWYFGRTVAAVTHVFNTSGVIEQQLEAIRCHTTPIANMAQQYALQAGTARRPQAETDAVLADPAAALCARVRAAAAEKGQLFGCNAAEYLRLHRTRFAGDATCVSNGLCLRSFPSGERGDRQSRQEREIRPFAASKHRQDHSPDGEQGRPAFAGASESAGPVARAGHWPVGFPSAFSTDGSGSIKVRSAAALKPVPPHRCARWRPLCP